MKTISLTQVRLTAAAALLILIALDNPAGAQQFYDHGRQWSSVQSGTAMPEDYYRQAERVQGPITKSTPPFGYYAAPRPKEVYRTHWNDANLNYASRYGLSPELNRSRTRQRPQVDAYGNTSAHLNAGYPENAAARALPAGTVYRYDSEDLQGSLHLPVTETRQKVSAKLYRPTASGDNQINGGSGTQSQMYGRSGIMPISSENGQN